jgi:hypothetical protein
VNKKMDNEQISGFNIKPLVWMYFTFPFIFFFSFENHSFSLKRLGDVTRLRLCKQAGYRMHL